MNALTDTVGQRAIEALRRLLSQIPQVDVHEVVESGPGTHADFVIHVAIGGEARTLACEVKANAPPRTVRNAINKLSNHPDVRSGRGLAVVVAPYLSPESRSLCRERNAGFVDFEGNVRLGIGYLSIDHSVATKPASERRELRSFFKPQAAKILKVLLGDLSRSWRILDLAARAGVSSGHVGNVRQALIDREWADLTSGGFRLSDPAALLDAWSASSDPLKSQIAYHSRLRGHKFVAAAKRAMGAASPPLHVAYASFSAARFFAPAVHSDSHFFLADAVGHEHLRRELQLVPALDGQNVFVILTDDDSVLRESVEPLPGAFCTGLVQTYLDLCSAGELGRTAADHLRQEKILSVTNIRTT